MATTRHDTSTKREYDLNPDPITGTPGAHPVGTGVGAAAGGAAAGIATGAAIGSVAGPVGTLVGAGVGIAAGAVGGGLAGKAVAEKVNPTAEHEYWRSTYQERPYVAPGATYEQYSPAYQYGWESESKYQGREFRDVEPDLSRNWETARGKSQLEWDKAKGAVQDSWERTRARTSSSSCCGGRLDCE